MFLYKIKKYGRLCQYQVLKLLSAVSGIVGGAKFVPVVIEKHYIISHMEQDGCG